MNEEHRLIDLDLLAKFLQNLREQLATAVSNHNSEVDAHPVIQTQISEIKNRLLTLEIAVGAEVTANPFAVTFGNLDGITANAVWNADEARLEF